MQKMKLHEEIEIERNLRVLRVPGGWIYYLDNEQVGGTWQTTSTFVPFDTK